METVEMDVLEGTDQEPEEEQEQEVELITVEVTLTGKTPLMMHNIRLSNPFDDHARRLKELSSKRRKTDQDLMDIARVEFEGGLYIDENGPYMPLVSVKKCFIMGARLIKLGKAVERGLHLTLDTPYLDYRGPKTAEGLWKAETYIDQRMAKIGKSMILRTRPVFPEWKLTAQFLLDIRTLQPQDLIEVLRYAGTAEGLGEARTLGFGRFIGSVEYRK
jgi:hypothetical protein